MSYFVCAFALLLVFILVVLDGSPALSAKDNRAKESSLQKADNVRKAKIRRIHNPKKNQLQKFNRQQLKLDRSKMIKGRLLDGRPRNKTVIKHKRKSGINAYRRKQVVFHKKKNTNRILKPNGIKKKKMIRFKNKNLKNKRKIVKKTRGKYGQSKNKVKSFKNEIIKKDTVKNVPENKKEMNVNSKNMKTTTENNAITSKSSVQQVGIITAAPKYLDVFKMRTTKTLNSSSPSTVTRKYFNQVQGDTHPWAIKYEEWDKVHGNEHSFHSFKKIMIEAEKERIKKFGGDPEKYSDICFVLMNWDCYQRSKPICTKNDRIGNCIKGYHTTSRYDDSGNLLVDPPVYFEVAPQIDFSRLHAYRSKQTCIWSDQKCVYFDKLLNQHPDLAGEIKHRFLTRLDEIEESKNDAGRFATVFKTDIQSKGNDYDAALYILHNLIMESHPGDCGYLLKMLPFLEDSFFNINESCE